MQVLPSDLVVPPLPYAVAILVGTAAVVAALYRLRPPVTEHTVLAATPWMALGGAVHGLEQYGLVPDPVVPFVTAPAVYLTTAVVAGAVWAAGATRTDSADADDTAASTRVLGLAGAVALALVIVFAYASALGNVDPVALAWPVVGVVGAVAVGAPVYYLLWTRWPTPTEQVGVGGAAAVFAHALDGVSTTIGVDLLGTGERSPIPRAIMEFAGRLPTEPYLGTGWLFVLAKLAVAAALVLLLAEYVEDEPAEGNLLVILVTAVGLGPAANNLILFLLTGSV